MSSIDLNPYVRAAACATFGTLVGGTGALIAVKGIQKGWAGARWAHSQGWSAPGQIANQGMEWARECVSRGKEVFREMVPTFQSKEMTLTFLTGVATALSFKFSPLAVKAEFPIQGKNHAIENRIFAIAVGVFAVTFCGLQACRKGLQMSHGSVFTHALAVTLVSLAAITLVDYRRSLARHPCFKNNPNKDFFNFYESIFDTSKRSRFNNTNLNRFRYDRNNDYRHVSWRDAGEVGVVASIAIWALAVFPVIGEVLVSAHPFNVVLAGFKTLHQVVPGSQGIYPAAFVMAAAYGATAPDAFQKQCQAGRERKPLKRYFWRFAPSIAMGVLGATLTPSLSALIFKERVQYLSSTLIGLGGVVGTAYLTRK